MNPYSVLQNNQNYAVIGLNSDTTRFSYRIYKLLKNKGKHAYGVHPKLETLEDERVYQSIEAIDKPVDVAVFVVNPTIGIHYLDAIKEKGINTIWLQPGTVNDDLLDKAKSLDLNVIEDCVLATYAVHESQ